LSCRFADIAVLFAQSSFFDQPFYYAFKLSEAHVILSRWYWFGFVGSLALLAIAYFYFQLELGLAPCPLCMFQRGALVGVAAFCLLGILFSPKKVGSKVLAFGVTLSSIFGLAIAGRQVWLQHLPADQVPECGPDLAFMLEAFPFQQMITTVLAGSGECAEVQWTLLGMSMPTWMVGIFVVMTLLSLKLLFLKERSYFSGNFGR
jgi:protein dithiol:quinone oxidoreductase